jgi:hypothetical protein
MTCLPIRRAPRSAQPVPATPSESSRAPGYLLEADPGAVDASRFARLAQATRARTRCPQKPRIYSIGRLANDHHNRRLIEELETLPGAPVGRM